MNNSTEKVRRQNSGEKDEKGNEDIHRLRLRMAKMVEVLTRSVRSGIKLMI